MGTEIPIKLDSFDKNIIIIFSVIILIFIGLNNNDLGNKEQRDESINVSSDSPDSGGINWLRNFISTYYPVFLGTVLLLLSNVFVNGGYANLLFLVILVSYLSSYSLSQGMLYYNTEEGADKKTDECAFKLPKSNMFETKEITFFRFIYFLTLVIICICMSSVNDKDSYYYFLNPYIFLIPFIFPIVTEVLSFAINKIHTDLGEKSKSVASIKPEQLLIQFMRGKHTGINTNDETEPEFKDRNWFITTGIDDEEVEKGTAFINSHLVYSMLFYGMLMWYVLIYSYTMPFTDSEKSSTPLTIAITIMLGYPIFMKYIFVQECSIDNISDNLPDGKYNPENNNIESVSDYDKRLLNKNNIFCQIEKYGGIQLLLCLSLLILITTNTSIGRDKLLVLVTITLLTYGLSQSFYSIEKRRD
jgi:hypothetical protein